MVYILTKKLAVLAASVSVFSAVKKHFKKNNISSFNIWQDVSSYG